MLTHHTYFRLKSRTGVLKHRLHHPPRFLKEFFTGNSTNLRTVQKRHILSILILLYHVFDNISLAIKSQINFLFELLVFHHNNVDNCKHLIVRIELYSRLIIKRFINVVINGFDIGKYGNCLRRKITCFKCFKKASLLNFVNNLNEKGQLLMLEIRSIFYQLDKKLQVFRII